MPRSRNLQRNVRIDPALLLPPMGTNLNRTLMHELCPSRNFIRCFHKGLARQYQVIPHYHATQHCGNVTDRWLSALTPNGRERLRCDSPPAELNHRLLLYIGVISRASESSRRRRRAIRNSWMQHFTVGDSILVCFVLSGQAGEPDMSDLRQEAQRHGDILFVDAPETRDLIRTKTRYSGFRDYGRGMPTFKQFAFFQYAATTLPNVDYIAKVDDDSAVNLRRLLVYLGRMRCYDHVLVGGIHWAGYVPRADFSGVRGDRCGWGWQLFGALDDYARTHGTLGAKGYKPACDTVGGLLPFPFATGAGYFLSSKAMRWVGTSPQVVDWVKDAAGIDREKYQWQKFEDTTMGYWLAYAPFSVKYLDINRWMHNGGCSKRGEEVRSGGDLIRPASNLSVIVHDLKAGGFRFAWDQMDPALGIPYDHAECLSREPH